MVRIPVAIAILAAAACGGGEEPPPPPPAPTQAELEALQDRALARLLAFENERRAATDFAALPPSNVALGPDPYRIAPFGGGTRIGILRGDAAVVLLDAAGAELARAEAPPSPSGLAIGPDGTAFVVGEGARELWRYRRTAAGLERTQGRTAGALGMRDVAIAPDGKTAYVVEEREGRLLAVALDGEASVRELGRCHGPLRVDAGVGYVATNCLLDHAIEIRRGDGDEVVRIHHDGPIWGTAIRRDAGGELAIAAGGVEDHPLLREDGGFGYIDSHVFVYKLAPGARTAVRVAMVNASELGAVTPKWLAWRDDRSLAVAGYGSAGLYTLAWRDADLVGAPAVTRAELPPGTAAADLAADGTLVAANPLLDAWIVAAPNQPPRTVAVASRTRRALPSRLGEALFFTTAMAPWNRTDGKLSRFTCETCHHEGYSDGRVHFTGRGKVHAASRPLLGLFNNRPHFSRALDKTMTQMVHAEFRVANRHNGRDPWFTLTYADAPVLAELGAPWQVPPEALREAFMSFLMDFTHRSNPAAAERRTFTDVERAGALAFRDRCAACHAPRLVADEPRTAAPFETWESLVMSPAGALVWSNAEYRRTGVEPYVHDKQGARVPSLRRLYKKWPYFTNGSAPTLADVLARFAWTPDAAFHDAAPAGAAHLTPADRAALLAFLELL
ncbi:MAG: c-type cytochrome [Deltaproteobacteria bacterium]|nr:c-type cytochrome [Deltaproteobacteria bacterium]